MVFGLNRHTVMKIQELQFIYSDLSDFFPHWDPRILVARFYPSSSRIWEKGFCGEPDQLGGQGVYVPSGTAYHPQQ